MNPRRHIPEDGELLLTADMIVRTGERVILHELRRRCSKAAHAASEIRRLKACRERFAA